MGLKGFVEGGAASVVAGCSTHPLDLIKVRMQLQGEAARAPAPAMRFALVFPPGVQHHHHHDHLLQPPRRPGPIAIGAQIDRRIEKLKKRAGDMHGLPAHAVKGYIGWSVFVSNEAQQEMKPSEDGDEIPSAIASSPEVSVRARL